MQLADNRFAVLLLGVTSFALGCGGGDNVTTYPISGTVMYKNQPVPAGSITLIPDAREGNTGVAVSLEIVDGKFDSELADRGHVGGKQHGEHRRPRRQRRR